MERATLVELEDGLSAGPLAGKGRLVSPSETARYDTFHAHCDLLVVGGGASGVAAAAAGSGRTILVHSGPTCELASDGDLRVLTGTTAVGLYDGNYVVAVERGRRVWHIRAKRIVLATGAIERPLVFPNNDRPGIMLAGAARRYELGGARVVVFTNNDTALGIPGATVVDARQGRLVVDTIGEDRLEGVVLDDGSRLACDVLAVSGGWSPAVHLWTQRGGRLRFDERLGGVRPGRRAGRGRGRREGRGRGAARGGAALARSRRRDACRSSTSSATRRSPTSAARSAPACARSSTSSATRRSAPAPSRGRRPA